MSKLRTKKYPILSYLFYALIIAVLFTGVTFSRYNSSTSGNFNTELAPFACSYEITDLSGSTFINSDYWFGDGSATEGSSTAVNTLRKLKYTVRNYTVDESGATLNVTGVNISNTLRLTGPLEFIRKLALQFADGDDNVLTPQYVLGQVFAIDESGDFTTGTINTGSEDYPVYDALPYSEGSETLTVTSSVGSVAIASGEEGKTGISLILTTYTVNNGEYSLGFHRAIKQELKTSEDDTPTIYPGVSTTPFYIDFQEDMTYCTLDIHLPQMELESETGGEVERSFILYFAMVERIKDVDSAVYYSDFLSIDSSSNNNDMVINTGESANSNASNVIGYHYDQIAQVYELNNGSLGVGLDESGVVKTQTIRIYKTFNDNSYTYYKVTDSGEELIEGDLCDVNGNSFIQNGTNNEYYALAELRDPFYVVGSDNTVDVYAVNGSNLEKTDSTATVRVLKDLASGKSYYYKVVSSLSEGVKTTTLTLLSADETFTSYLKYGDEYYLINDLADDEFLILTCASKEYELKFNSIFVQTSQVGGN